jgi:hypothetical protein
MKNLIFAFAILLLTSCSPDRAKEYHYNGTIVSKGYEAPTSGYKSSQKARYYIMMREDRTGQIIRVNVTIPSWHSLTEGQRTGFVLSNRDLYYSGNTSDMTKNLYGE